MHLTGQSLLKLLFNQDEEVCVSDDQFGYRSIPYLCTLNGDIPLMSPNEKVPWHMCDSSELILVAINPITGFRRDENVTAFRSYLIELDMGTIKEQLGTIAHLKMPFSAQIFSGNKSVHTVITLAEDLKDEKDYRNLGNWIFNIVSQADQNCKNPSRSIRIPGAIRNNGKKQRLIGSIGKRITHEELFAWLNQYPHLRPVAKEKKVVVPGNADYSRLSPWARGILKKGLDTSKLGRNQTWFALAVDFAKAGFSEEGTVEELSKMFVEERDFKQKEWDTTIKSAFKKVTEGK